MAASLTAPGATARRRRLSSATRLLTGLLLFLGVSAVGGGGAMVLAPDGGLVGMDLAVLACVRLVDDWLLPGVFLLVVLGVGSLLTAWSVVRRPHPRWAATLERRTGHDVAWTAALAEGLVLVGFILYEAQVVTAPEGRWLQRLMGGIGAAITVLALAGPVRRDLRSPG